uniref:Uncharacterized protein n=1 Tax=Vespula pensylvanica TaxID=30213 RepID=A0A834P4W6_VESPE|nr:hypothetical protein H0235_005478 [Vespula pensylvanica]
MRMYDVMNVKLPSRWQRISEAEYEQEKLETGRDGGGEGGGGRGGEEEEGGVEEDRWFKTGLRIAREARPSLFLLAKLEQPNERDRKR